MALVTLSLDMAKRVSRVGSIGFVDQSGCKSKQVIFKRDNQVAGQMG